MGFILILIHCVALSYSVSASEHRFIWNITTVSKDNQGIVFLLPIY